MMRRIALVVLTGLVVIGALLTAAGARDPLPAAQPTDNPALTHLAECVRQPHATLLVAFLIDQSGSLGGSRGTDPNGDRVKGVQLALAGLEQLTESSGRGPHANVEVLLTGFDGNFSKYGSWTSLDKRSLGGLDSEAAKFRSRNRGHDTDYYVALKNVQAALGQRSAQETDSTTQPCNLVLWFTDGQYEIDDRTKSDDVKHYGLTKSYAPEIRLDQPGAGQQLVARGKQLLCAPSSGVVDQLRLNDVDLIVAPFSQRMQHSDLDFLSEIAGGEQFAGDAPSQCGSGTPLGMVLDGSTLEAMKAAFDLVGQGASGGSPIPGNPSNPPLCPHTACAAGTQYFTIDHGILRFHVLALTAAPQIEVLLQPPGGKEVDLRHRDGSIARRVGDASITDTWIAANALLIDADTRAGARNWFGKWKIVFIDPTGDYSRDVARSQIFVFGGLEPALAGKVPIFRRGVRATITARIKPEGNAPKFDSRFFANPTITATITDPDPIGLSVPTKIRLTPSGGVFRATYTPPQQTEAQSLNLVLELDLTTQSGVALAPVLKNYAIELRPPAPYPHITTAHPFDSIEGHHTSTATYTITGGDAAGCAWLEHSSINTAALPAGVHSVALAPTTASTESSCVHVGVGQSRTISVRVTPDGTGDGVLVGAITWGLEANGQPRLATTTAVRISIEREINQTFRILIFVFLFIPGLLVPFVLLWLIKWLTARVEGRDGLRYKRIPITVAAGEVRGRSPDGAPPMPIGPDGLENLSKSATDEARGWMLGEIHVAPWVTWNPLVPPTGQVFVKRTAPIVGVATRTSSPYRVELSPEVAPTWIFSFDRDVDPDDPRAEIDGDLYVFVHQSGRGFNTEYELSTVSDSVQRDLARLVADVRDARIAAAVAPEPEPVITLDGPPQTTRDATGDTPPGTTRVPAADTPPVRPRDDFDTGAPPASWRDR